LGIGVTIEGHVLSFTLGSAVARASKIELIGALA